MLQIASGASLQVGRRWLSRRFLCIVAAAGLILAASPIISTAQPASSRQSTAAEFYGSLVGEWVGVCEQSTDGERAPNKYFHVVVEQTGADTFQSRFTYHRLDEKTGLPLNIGESTVTTTIEADGTANTKITGQGTVLVRNEPKKQRHELVEVQSAAGPGSLTGRGGGTIKVSGMPLGLGRNGKVVNARSDWSLKNGTLTIHQALKARFPALVFSKSFNVEAHYTARRGSDVASLMGKTSVSAKPRTGVSRRS